MIELALQFKKENKLNNFYKLNIGIKVNLNVYSWWTRTDGREENRVSVRGISMFSLVF